MKSTWYNPFHVWEELTLVITMCPHCFHQERDGLERVDPRATISGKDLFFITTINL